MKALTVWQPWATFIIKGWKPWEFRRWDYRDRQPDLEGQRIVIHAATRPIKQIEVEDILERLRTGDSSLQREPVERVCAQLLQAFRCRGVLPMSCGLGTVTIGKPRRVGEIFGGHPDSDRLNHHLYGWPMQDVKEWEQPIEHRGAQGFWNWQGSVGRNLEDVPVKRHVLEAG